MSLPVLTPARAQALEHLLDDPSPKVQAAVQAELQRQGAGGVQLLQRIIREAKAVEQVQAAKRLLAELAAPEPAEDFARFIQGLNYELETGLLMLNRVVEPTLDIAEVREQLNSMARRVRELAPAPYAPLELCRTLNRVLFHEWGFRGNIEDYEDPRNSFLTTVLARRKGIPLSLSAIYLLVAERVGLELAPIATPGHFMVGYLGEGDSFFIDVFARGHLLMPEELESQLESQQITQPYQYLQPAPIGEVLCRACRNLVNHYTVKNQMAQAQLFTRFVRMFQETHRQASS